MALDSEQSCHLGDGSRGCHSYGDNSGVGAQGKMEIDEFRKIPRPPSATGRLLDRDMSTPMEAKSLQAEIESQMKTLQTPHDEEFPILPNGDKEEVNTMARLESGSQNLQQYCCRGLGFGFRKPFTRSSIRIHIAGSNSSYSYKK
ncbi:hypothetical protein SUGI_1033580 [Cryptomeria japonica]|nr:hypothetical protein SUGI_1033580 [Cryptomeria japonica]